MKTRISAERDIESPSSQKVDLFLSLRTSLSRLNCISSESRGHKSTSRDNNRKGFAAAAKKSLLHARISILYPGLLHCRCCLDDGGALVIILRSFALSLSLACGFLQYSPRGQCMYTRASARFNKRFQQYRLLNGSRVFLEMCGVYVYV